MLLQKKGTIKRKILSWEKDHSIRREITKWRKKDGKNILINKMSNTHIRNAEKYLRKCGNMNTNKGKIIKREIKYRELNNIIVHE